MIRVNQPLFCSNTSKLLCECIKTNWVSSEGPFVAKFENEFAHFCNVRYGVACSNGTAALHLGLLSSEIKKDDEVIIPAFTMIATAYAVIYSGAKPVLVDAEPKTWNMDTERIKGRLTKKTRAIMPVHIYGHPVNMDLIWKIARGRKIKIIEDAAEAHGAEYNGVKTGGLGDVGCFSFYANKIITTGEGGMVITNSKKIAEKARYFRNMAFQKNVRFLHRDIGYNYRMTNLQAAVGLAQVSKIARLVNKKRKIAELYNQRLNDIEGISIPREEPWAKNVYWMYSILVDQNVFGLSRDKFREHLYKEGIDTRSFFIPMHRQPVFKKMGLFVGERYPVADSISRNGLYLPSGFNMDENLVNYVCDKIKKIKKTYG